MLNHFNLFLSNFSQVDLVKTEMSTLRSKHLRELDDVRERLDRALSNNAKDQTLRDKILNDAKVEILTLSDKVRRKFFFYK